MRKTPNIATMASLSPYQFLQREHCFMSDIDLRDLRDAFGSFATGVTVVTTLCNVDLMAKTPVAMTANSFCSVSLDPPLVLWSIDKKAKSFDAFSKSEHFAVHILHGGQRELSSICATRNADKFANEAWRSGIEGVPILADYNTCFQCSVEHKYDGGDHEIIVGRVLDFDNNERESHTNPLLFYRGKYTEVA
jgi:flavin reductase (DIM6/NTAB) family NADH-FMN oxidoreductase RutF